MPRLCFWTRIKHQFGWSISYLPTTATCKGCGKLTVNCDGECDASSDRLSKSSKHSNDAVMNGVESSDEDDVQEEEFDPAMLKMVKF